MTLPKTIKAHPNYRGKIYDAKGGVEREYGRWYNFGGNVSWASTSPNSYRIRLDTTGEVHWPTGPAGKDACMMALYRGRDYEGFAAYCFGPAYLTREEKRAAARKAAQERGDLP